MFPWAGVRALLGRLWHRRPPWEVIGAAAAVLVFVGASLSYAFSTPLFYYRDEKAHLGYAHTVAEGRLPRIDTFSPVPDSATIWQEKLSYSPDDRYRQVWVANHPPLTYVAAAPIVWYSDLTGRPDGGLLLLRLMNAGFAAVGVVLTYLVGYELSGGRRWIGLAATSIVALAPHPHLWFSQAMNDGLGFAAVTFVLWAGVRYLRRGHSAGGLALLSAAVAVASASRAAGLLVALSIVGAVALHRLWSRAGPLRERLRAGVLTGAVALGPAAALVGWFYLRNVVLYGDIGASSFLLDRFTREPAGSVLGLAADTMQWEIAYRTVVSQTTMLGPEGYSYVDVGVPVRLVVVLAAIGLALAFLSPWFRSVRGPKRSRDGGLITGDARSGIVWPGVLVSGVVIGVVMATYAQHVAGGGLPHYRYLYPTLPALAALVALGLDRLVPRALLVLVVAGQALLLAPLVLPTGRTYRAQAAEMPEGMAKIPEGWSFPHTASVGVALVAGLLLVTVLAGLAATPVARRLRAASLPGDVAAGVPAPKPTPACSRRKLRRRKGASAGPGDARGELVRGAGW